MRVFIVNTRRAGQEVFGSDLKTFNIYERQKLKRWKWKAEEDSRDDELLKIRTERIR